MAGFESPYFNAYDHGIDVDDADEIPMKTRPHIPIELPPPPDLSNLPSHILHSGTVETLIGQNDDLMARLKVNIRRNSLLEQKILEQESIVTEMQRANSSLLSQIQVFEEKELIAREKSSRIDSTHDALKAELNFLSNKNASLETQNSEFRLAARYVRRIRKWVTPFIDKLKADLARERATTLTKDATISDLRARLNEVIHHSQTAERQAMKNQAALVERYEAAIKKLQNELDRSRFEGKLLRDKANRVELAAAEAAGHINRIIFLERHTTEQNELIKNLQTKTSLLEAELANRDTILKSAHRQDETSTAHEAMPSLAAESIDCPLEVTLEGNC